MLNLGRTLPQARRYMHRAYHGTRKFLQHVDTYANMTRRVMVASQPLLEDMGVHQDTFGKANEAFRRYDVAKEGIERAHDQYSRLAAAVQ